jgi:hypothetical protein
MVYGGKKFEKTNKSKFKKYQDRGDVKDEEFLKQKRKHHDKTMYRLVREEEKDLNL